MKDDEKKFFIICLVYISKISNDGLIKGEYTPRELINIIKQWVAVKRCWYYLEKWCDLGFYDYGVTLDLGWLILDKIPPRYEELINTYK